MRFKFISEIFNIYCPDKDMIEVEPMTSNEATFIIMRFTAVDFCKNQADFGNLDTSGHTTSDFA